MDIFVLRIFRESHFCYCHSEVFEWSCPASVQQLYPPSGQPPSSTRCFRACASFTCLYLLVELFQFLYCRWLLVINIMTMFVRDELIFDGSFRCELNGGVFFHTKLRSLITLALATNFFEPYRSPSLAVLYINPTSPEQ